MDRRSLIAAGLAAPLVPGAARAAPTSREPDGSFRLWPGDPPGLRNAALDDHVFERSADPAIRDRAMDRIRNPRLDVFRAARPNGAAVLIAPGGAYQRVVLDKEGYELGAWLAARGVTAFVLFYRLPAEGWADGPNTPLADAQRAMRMIRARAAEWQVDPARVAALGYSAGGHLCADLATRHRARVYAPVDDADALDARPALAAPIYPVISMEPAVAHMGSRNNLIGSDASAELEWAHSAHSNAGEWTPPMFLVHAEDDRTVPVANSLLMREALKAARVACELHLFEEGGHGFGLRLAPGMPAAAWPELFLAWAGRHGLTG